MTGRVGHGLATIGDVVANLVIARGGHEAIDIVTPADLCQFGEERGALAVRALQSVRQRS